MRKPLWLILFALASGGVVFTCLPGEGYAQTRYGRVTAHSHYGNGSVTGAVRRRGRVYEVQLPSGFWEDCEGNCSEALRRNHLDYWETINEEAPDSWR